MNQLEPEQPTAPADGRQPPATGGLHRPSRGRPRRDDPAIGPARLAVNRALTPRRRRRATENDEYAAFALRVLRAWARRVAAGDVDAIADMAAAARELDEAIRAAVGGLKGKGYSWAEIAARLGVTRQAAQQRWGGGRDLPAKPARRPAFLPTAVTLRRRGASATGREPIRARPTPAPGVRARLPGGVTR